MLNFVVTFVALSLYFLCSYFVVTVYLYHLYLLCSYLLYTYFANGCETVAKWAGRGWTGLDGAGRVDGGGRGRTGADGDR